MVHKTAQWYNENYTVAELRHLMRKVRQPRIDYPPRALKSDMIALCMQWDSEYGSTDVSDVEDEDMDQGSVSLDTIQGQTPLSNSDQKQQSSPGQLGASTTSDYEDAQDDSDEDEAMEDEDPDSASQDDRTRDSGDSSVGDSAEGTAGNDVALPDTLKNAILNKWHEWLEANKTGRADLADPLEDELADLEAQAKKTNPAGFTAWKFGEGGYGVARV